MANDDFARPDVRMDTHNEMPRGRMVEECQVAEIPGVKSKDGKRLSSSGAAIIRRLGAGPIRFRDLTNTFGVMAADNLLDLGLAKFTQPLARHIELTENGRAAFAALDAKNAENLAALHIAALVLMLAEPVRAGFNAPRHVLDGLIALKLARESSLFTGGISITDAGRAKLVEAGWLV